MAIPWPEIREEYITTKISQRQLAKKYGISVVGINGHATKENWLQLREEYTKKKRKEIDSNKPKPRDIPGLMSAQKESDPGEETTDKQRNRERFRRYAQATMELAPIDTRDPVEVEMRIKDYFDCCYQNDITPQKPGLAKWIGVTPRTLDRWYFGEIRNSTHREIMERAYGILEEGLYEQLQNGQINPGSGIFLLKNMFWYKDVQDIAVAPKNPLGDLQNIEELRKRIEGTVVDEDFSVAEEGEQNGDFARKNN